jgi:archaellum biogenesis ATPase FlaH
VEYEPDKFLDVTEASIQELQDQKTPTYTGAELFELNSESIPCLFGQIIPAKGCFSITGGSDVGKSILFRQMAIECVQGHEFIGWENNARHRKVIVIATEDDNIATSFFIKKQSKNIKDLERIRFYFETENILEYLEEQLNLEPADLIIIDAWSDVFGQNLNDSSLIRTTLNLYRSLANKHNCSIGFLHHTAKRTQNLAPSKDNILSGQGFEAKMRLVFELRNDKRDENIKHLCIVKGNYLGKEYKNSSYKLFLNPDDFNFTYTGERVPFEELATKIDAFKAVRSPLKKAEDVDNISHSKNLAEIFGPKPRLSRAELLTRISMIYAKNVGTDFSPDRAKKFLDYLVNDLKMISKFGKERSPNGYYFLSSEGGVENIE